MASTRFSIEAIFKGIDKFSAPVARMTTSMDRFMLRLKKGMTGIGHMTKRVSRGMRTMAITTGTMAVLGGYALKGLIKPAMDFEQAMDGVRAVTLDQAEQNIPLLTKRARELGRQTRYGATEVARSMEILGRAGLKHSEIADAIEPILRAAEAEEGAIEPIADVIIASLKGMGIGFDKTAEKANVLAYASAATKSTILELGEGLSKVAPVAKQFSMDFDEVVASVALLQDVGIEASMSGTQMKTMFSKLAMLTPKAAGRFRKLGIEISKDGKNMLPLVDLIAAIANGLDRASGNIGKVEAISEAVGLRGSTAANILAEANRTGKLLELVKQLRENAQAGEGAAPAMARTRMENLAGDLIKLSNAWDAFRIDVVTPLLPKLSNYVQMLTEFLSDPENIKKFTKYLGDAVIKIESFWENNKTFLKELLRVTVVVVQITWAIIKFIGKIAVGIGKLLGKTFDLADTLAELVPGSDAFNRWMASFAPTTAEEYRTEAHVGTPWAPGEVYGVIEVKALQGTQASAKTSGEALELLVMNPMGGL